MGTVLAVEHNHPQGPALVRKALTALGAAWAAHTLKRAIADVSSTSDQAYRDFGLDKAEILIALGRLRKQIAVNSNTQATAMHPGRLLPCTGADFVIEVARRKPQTSPASRSRFRRRFPVTSARA